MGHGKTFLGPLCFIISHSCFMLASVQKTKRLRKRLLYEDPVDSSLKKKTDRITSALSAFLLLPLTPSFFSFDLGSAHQKEPSATDAKLSQENIGYFLK